MKRFCPPGLRAASAAGTPGARVGCSNLTVTLSTLDQRLQPSALYGVLRLPCQGPFTGCSQLQKAVCPGSGCQKPESRCWRGELRGRGLPGWSPSAGAGGGSLRPRGAPGNSRDFRLVVASLLPGLLSSHGSLSPRVPVETPVTSREGPAPPQNDCVVANYTCSGPCSKHGHTSRSREGRGLWRDAQAWL